MVSLTDTGFTNGGTGRGSLHPEAIVGVRRHGVTGPINSHPIGGGNRNLAYGSLMDHSAGLTVPQCGCDPRRTSPLSCTGPQANRALTVDERI